jgi:hypothetical protein
MKSRVFVEETMLQIFAVFTVLVLLSAPVFARQDDFTGIKGVRFKDGTVVMGTVLKMNAEQVVIKNSDDRIIVREFNEIHNFILSEGEGFRGTPAVAPRGVDKKASDPGGLQAGGAESVAGAKTNAAGARRIRWFAGAGGGTAGEAKASSVQIEGGGYTINQPLNMLFVLGGAVTFDRDETPRHVYDYPCPQNVCQSLGTKRKGEEVGLFTKLGIEPVNNSGIFLFAKGGVTVGREIELVRSYVTSRYYEQSRTDKTYGVYGGGLGYFPKEGRLSLHLEYDNRMGISGGAGFCW